jgi:hypothetical protein
MLKITNMRTVRNLRFVSDNHKVMGLYDNENLVVSVLASVKAFQGMQAPEVISERAGMFWYW